MVGRAPVGRRRPAAMAFRSREVDWGAARRSQRHSDTISPMQVHRVWLTVAIAAAQFSTGLARAAPKADNEAQLAKAWAELHPGEEAPPPCEHKDPVRSVTGKVDQAPGKEHVVASRRYGVVLLSAAGHPLAWAAIG